MREQQNQDLPYALKVLVIQEKVSVLVKWVTKLYDYNVKCFVSNSNPILILKMIQLLAANRVKIVLSENMFRFDEYSK